VVGFTLAQNGLLVKFGRSRAGAGAAE